MTATATQHPPATEQELNEMRRTVIDRVHELMQANINTPLSGVMVMDEAWMASTTDDIQRYSPDVLIVIEAALREDNEMAGGVASQINHGCHPNVIKDTLHFHAKTGATDYLRTIADVAALIHYDCVNEHLDLSTVDEYVQQQCIALMEFAKLVDTLPEEPSPFLNYEDDLNYDLRVINDPELVTLIAHRPHDIAKIAEIVLQYRTSNAAAINGIIEGAFPPVAEGYL